jgi:hypothetical protein
MKDTFPMIIACLLAFSANAEEIHTSLSTAAKEKMDSLAVKISATIEGKRPHGYLATLPDGSKIFLLTNLDIALANA